jgi:hypothetical protein
MNTKTERFVERMLVPFKTVQKMEAYCQKPTTENIPRGAVLFDDEITFPGGKRMAIQVIASEEPDNDSAWTQGVLFSRDGFELGCTDVGESFLGEYCVMDNAEYVCIVSGYTP